MLSLKERVKQLQTDLGASPLRHYVYNDLPFAIFCYRPEEEWVMRDEIKRLKTRVRQETQRQIAVVSLAELMWQSIDESEGLDAVRSRCV